MIWAILTGEYPPVPGSVGEHSRIVARALVAAGDAVHVWTGPAAGATPDDAGVRVVRDERGFGPAGLAALERFVRELPRPHRLLVQYVPHAFGWKAMNLPFCFWLRAHRSDAISILFHEVATPRAGKLRHHVLARTTELMASIAARAAEHVFVSTSAWDPILRRLGPSSVAPVWIPPPSTLPVPAPERVAAVRARFPADAMLVGHLGTGGRLVRPLVLEALPRLLGEGRVGMLLGTGGPALADELRRSHPGLRLHAPGAMSAEELAEHTAACDLLVQPFPDGVTTRRSSVVAPLALGRPVVTNEGFLTEPLWKETGAVALATLDGIVEVASELLRDRERREALSARGRELFHERFGIERTIATLRGGRP